MFVVKKSLGCYLTMYLTYDFKAKKFRWTSNKAKARVFASHEVVTDLVADFFENGFYTCIEEI